MLVDQKLPVLALVWLLELVFVDGLVLDFVEVHLRLEMLLG